MNQLVDFSGLGYLGIKTLYTSKLYTKIEGQKPLKEIPSRNQSYVHINPKLMLL